jgi:hypothetical protein
MDICLMCPAFTVRLIASGSFHGRSSITHSSGELTASKARKADGTKNILRTK